MDRIFNYDNEKLDFFPSVGLKLTGACRFKCPFCCEPDRTQEVAPIDKIIEITDLLHQFSTKRLCLTGGDPLLYPNISQLLKHTKALGFYNLLLTTDGKLLNNKHQELLPFLDAVRFSVHALHSEHDKIVGHTGAFMATQAALDILKKAAIYSFVTTVVTRLNINAIADIAEWCFSKNVKKYFLFGLMRSGLGQRFIEEHGEVLSTEISDIITKLRSKYSAHMEIVYYDYTNKSECILIYGDGRVVIDPYPESKSFQLEIGNIFSDTRNKILDRFFQDPKNYEGYCGHLNMYNKAVSEQE